MRVVFAAVLAIIVAALAAAQGAATALEVVATIPMPEVGGRIDHLTFDPARQRLFVAALGNDSVEVIDTSKNVLQRSLRGFHEPQGIVVVPDLNAVAVANGGSGTLQLLDAASLATRWTRSTAIRNRSSWNRKDRVSTRTCRAPRR
ncbi:MAG: hypothetical protein DMF87_03685 [Acidobacteria bacterium]|nr:MAG: hypothetical protein DMF87_03685 [Acidobacteriota bacterium]